MTEVTDTCPKCGVICGKIVGDSVYYSCGTTAVCHPDGSLSELQVRCKKESKMPNISELLAKLRETRRTLKIHAHADRHWHVSLHDPNTQEIVSVGVSSELTTACAGCLDNFTDYQSSLENDAWEKNHE